MMHTAAATVFAELLLCSATQCNINSGNRTVLYHTDEFVSKNALETIFVAQDHFKVGATDSGPKYANQSLTWRWLWNFQPALQPRSRSSVKNVT